jgi:hypothetical protein
MKKIILILGFIIINMGLFAQWQKVNTTSATDNLQAGGNKLNHNDSLLFVKHAADSTAIAGKEPLISKSTGYLYWNGSAWSAKNESYYLRGDTGTTLASKDYSNGRYQIKGSYLTTISGISAGGVLSGTYPNPGIASGYYLPSMTDQSNWNGKLSSVPAGYIQNNVGIAGGTTLIGGTAASENLTLSSTSNATKGLINIGASSNYNEATNLLTLGTTTNGGNQTINSNNGAEMFTNFNTSNWTLTSGWDNTNAGNTKINKNAAGTTTATLNTVAPSIDTLYKLVITMDTYTATNGLTYSFGGVTGNFTFTSATTITDYIIAKTTTGLIFTPNNTAFRGSINAISIIPLSQNGTLNLAGGLLNISNNNLTNNTVDGIRLWNNTASDATYLQRNSPAISFLAQSNTTDAKSYFRTYAQSLGNLAVGQLNFDYSTDGITWLNVMNIYPLTNNINSSYGFLNTYAANAPNASFDSYLPNTRDNYWGGLSLLAATAATSSFKIQYSPLIFFKGQVWNASAANEVHDYRQFVRPIASTSTSELITQFSSDNNTTWNDALSVKGTYGTTTPNVIVYNNLSVGTTTPQFGLDVNKDIRIIGANALYYGGTATSASDYSHKIYNSSGELINMPRVDATNAFSFYKADGTTRIWSLNSTNPGVVLNGRLSLGNSTAKAQTLNVNGKVSINKDSLSRTTAKIWGVVQDTATGNLARQLLPDTLGNHGSVITVDQLNSVIQKITYTYQVSDILAGNAMTIIAAPGAGKYISIHGIEMNYKYNSTPYTSSKTIKIYYNNNDMTYTSNYFTNSSVPWHENFSSLVYATSGTTSPENQSILIKTNANTSGNSPIKVVIWYSIETY